MFDVGDLPVLSFGNCVLKTGVIKWPKTVRTFYVFSKSKNVTFYVFFNTGPCLDHGRRLSLLLPYLKAVNSTM